MTTTPSTDSVEERIEEIRADAGMSHSIETIYVCEGCARTAYDPVADLKSMQEAGHLSCCPERKIVERKLHVHAAQPNLSDELKAIGERHQKYDAGAIEIYSPDNYVRGLIQDRATLLRIVSDVVRMCAGIVSKNTCRGPCCKNRRELAEQILSLTGQPIKTEAEIRAEERKAAERAVFLAFVDERDGQLLYKPATRDEVLASIRKHCGVG